jgi:hypothetical protein
MTAIREYLIEHKYFSCVRLRTEDIRYPQRSFRQNLKETVMYAVWLWLQTKLEGPRARHSLCSLYY